MKPTIGKTESGKDMIIDVPRLLLTRMLVQASSGGGKSFALRRILEQTASHVQQVILDIEGEFTTLREKFDYIICAPYGADAVATPQTATILARRLRETRASAIIDLYEMKMPDRKKFVRLFLEEFVEAPKSMWHPCIVVVDEAHHFCPEKDEAESMAAVNDLITRGRKRGLCGILATQRLSKLNKDSAAELHNKLLGLAVLDTDIKRASDDLGLSAKVATPVLRSLDPGEFFAFGPALNRIVTKIKVGPVITTHPEAGSGATLAPPPPSAKIKELLAKLTDLPQVAEQEARTLADYKREVANLKRELTLAQKAQPKQPATEIKRIEVPVVGMKAIKGIQAADASMRKTLGKMRIVQEAVQVGLTGYQQSIEKLLIEFRKVQNAQAPQISKSAPVKTVPVQAVAKTVSTSGNGADISLGVGERKILTAAAQHQEGVTREQLTVMTGYKRSSRDTFLHRLKKVNAIEIQGDRIFATSEGIDMLGNFLPLPVGEELRNYWMARLPGGEKKLLEILVAAYPDGVERNNLDDAAGYKRSSRDTFIHRLRNRQLIEVHGTAVRASERLF
jgi:hypothetical protein